MNIHGKQDVIRSLDALLYCYFVYNYFLDASLLIFFSRIFLQLQMLAPQALARSLRTALGMVTTGLGLCVLMHATSEPGQPGLLIDFVGNHNKPSHMRVILLDLIIYVLQVIRIFATTHLSSQLQNGAFATTLLMPPSLAAALGADRVPLAIPRRQARNNNSPASNDDGDASYDNGFHLTEDLVFDIGFRSSIRNVLDPVHEDEVDRLPV
ncbi:hypothetical protein BCR43DRAFT_489492 [Syncephalastrum racemosum]|uniref:DUF1746 domain-containing protein n=1 Tax=Syncephalastrum racemosum TaxID=13706 RepID=A0A1X2HE80_SYNRA|nr:hypothetical protein BCR43DRAFT_489492 [Syncephalastrum racemosum]